MVGGFFAAAVTINVSAVSETKKNQRYRHDINRERVSYSLFQQPLHLPQLLHIRSEQEDQTKLLDYIE